MGRVIAVFLFLALLATYIVVVMVPAFVQAGGFPPNFMSLAMPPALMVGGYIFLFGFSIHGRKKPAEGTKE